MDRYWLQIDFRDNSVRQSGFGKVEHDRISAGYLSGAWVVEYGSLAFYCRGRYFGFTSTKAFCDWLEEFDYEQIDDWATGVDGDFAVIVHDRRACRAWLVADRNGQCRTYYSLQGNTATFGNALLEFTQGLSNPRLSSLGIYDVLAFGYSVDPSTVLEGVFVSTPGSVIAIEPGKIATRKYYSPVTFNCAYWGSEREAALGLLTAFEGVVSKRLQPSRNPAVLLSGGIDSVVMLQLLSKLAPTRPRAFTFGLSTGEANQDEVTAAQLAAKHFGVAHHVVLIDPTQVGEKYVDSVFETDGPFYGNALWLLLRERLLEDTFACDLFTGQDTRLHTPTTDFPKAAGLWFNRSSSSRVKRLLSAACDWAPRWPARGRNTLAYWSRCLRPRDSVQQYFLEVYMGYRGSSGASGSCGQSHHEAVIARIPAFTSGESMQHYYKELIAFEYKTQFTDDMNALSSAVSGGGLQLHFPFYDHEAVEACNRVPFRIGARQVFSLNSWSQIPFTQKAVLRALLDGAVPRDLLYRRKSTLPTIHIAFNGYLQRIVGAVLDEWLDAVIEVVSEEVRKMMLATVKRFRATTKFTFPQHHDLLWSAYVISWCAVMHQLTERSHEAVRDDLRFLAGRYIER